MFRVVTHSRSVHVAFIAAGVTLVAAVAYLGIATFWIPAEISLQQMSAAREGVATVLSHLQHEGDAVASLPQLVAAIDQGNAYALLGILDQEKGPRDIGLMGVTDADGYIISRTKNPESRGENALLTSEIGRELSSGRGKASGVVYDAFDPRQVFLSSGRWIYRGSTKLGVLFANDLADDDFATRFAATYLAPGTQVAFYTRDYGEYGSSFSDGDRSLIERVIQSNSDFVRAGEDDVSVVLPSGEAYLVRNVALSTDAANPSGVLVFVPIRASASATIVLFLPVAVFLAVVYMLRRRNRDRMTRPYLASVIVVAIAFVVVSVGIALSVRYSYHEIQQDRYPLYNSTLRLVPEGGVYASTYARTISLVLDTGGEAINTVSATIHFDPRQVSVQGVDIEHSICQFFITTSIDVVHGLVTIECGTPTPGFAGSGGAVATLEIARVKAGHAELHFDPSTQVLANDGLATNVLRATTDASIDFADPTASASGALSVYSPTHPNEARWYSSRNVTLTWLPRTPVSIDIISASSTKSIGPVTPPYTYTVPSDGEYAFRLSRPGATTFQTYTTRIDATPPQDLKIWTSNTVVPVGSVVRLALSATDALSGLERLYFISIDGDLYYPVGPDVYVPLSAVGTHTIAVRAYDRVGNMTQSDIRIDAVNEHL